MFPLQNLAHKELSDDHCVNGLAQDCGNSSALAMELLQSCIHPSISDTLKHHKATMS